MAAAEEEGEFSHIGYHRDSVSVSKQGIRHSRIGHRLDLLQHFGRGEQAALFASAALRNIYNRARREQRGNERFRR